MKSNVPPLLLNPGVPSVRTPWIQLFMVLCFVCGNLTLLNAEHRYWVGSGNWNSTNNWSNSSNGASGASVPGTSDIVIFDNGSASTCNVNVDVSVLEISIKANFSGTINLNSGKRIQTTTYVQLAGTFTGSSGEMTVFSNYELKGGIFTFSGLLNVMDDFAEDIPPADIAMGFESASEPSQNYVSMPPSRSSSNGCLEGRTWNEYYAWDVCVAQNAPLSDFAIQRSSAQKRSGSYGLRFYLKSSDPNNWPSGEPTHRAELSPNAGSPIDRYPDQGDEVWYGMSVYFPSNFVFSPSGIADDTRFIIAQWQHGSPGSAMISLEIIGNQIMLSRKGGSSGNPTWNEPDPLVTIQKGQWIDLVLRVKWERTNGLTEIWANGVKKYTNTSMQTVYNNVTVGGGFKYGIYYWRWKDKQSVIDSRAAGIVSREIFIDQVKEYKGVNGYDVVSP